MRFAPRHHPALGSCSPGFESGRLAASPGLGAVNRGPLTSKPGTNMVYRLPMKRRPCPLTVKIVPTFFDLGEPTNDELSGLHGVALGKQPTKGTVKKTRPHSLFQ